MATRCESAAQERRRPFWATQPACGESYDSCGASCGTPGLQLTFGSSGTSIATTGWIEGLVLNILNTEKRAPNSLCGTPPSGVKGHWSESFIDPVFGLYGGAQGGYRVGTNLYRVDTSRMRINQAVATIEATLQADLQKLVELGVATEVRVTATYEGQQRVRAVVDITGPGLSAGTRVALLGVRDSQMGYYWSS